MDPGRSAYIDAAGESPMVDNANHWRNANELFADTDRNER